MREISIFYVLSQALARYAPLRVIFSEPQKGNDYKKKTLSLKQNSDFFWQEEAFLGNQVFHTNFFQAQDVETWFNKNIRLYKQALVQTEKTDYHVLLRSTGIKLKLVKAKDN